DGSLLGLLRGAARAVVVDGALHDAIERFPGTDDVRFGSAELRFHAPGLLSQRHAKPQSRMILPLPRIGHYGPDNGGLAGNLLFRPADFDADVGRVASIALHGPGRPGIDLRHRITQEAKAPGDQVRDLVWPVPDIVA